MCTDQNLLHLPFQVMKGASAFAKATVAKTGGDAYGLTLKILMASVCASGSVMVRSRDCTCFHY